MDSLDKTLVAVGLLIVAGVFGACTANSLAKEKTKRAAVAQGCSIYGTTIVCLIKEQK